MGAALTRQTVIRLDADLTGAPCFVQIKVGFVGGNEPIGDTPGTHGGSAFLRFYSSLEVGAGLCVDAGAR